MYKYYRTIGKPQKSKDGVEDKVVKGLRMSSKKSSSQTLARADSKEFGIQILPDDKKMPLLM